MSDKIITSLNPGSPAGISGLGSMAACRSVAEMRQYTPLTRDAEELIDGQIIKVGVERLAIVADWLSLGLTFNVPNPMGTASVYYQKVSKVGHAKRTMALGGNGENKNFDFSGTTIPFYATWDDFEIDIRTLEASRRGGFPLDLGFIGEGARRVNEGIEDAAINGSGLNVAGNSAPGLLNEANVNTTTLVGAWTGAYTGAQVLTDVQNAVASAKADLYFGPFTLYIGSDQDDHLNNDFKAESDLTIRQRLEQLSYGGKKLRIVVADRLPDDTTVLVQTTSNVVDVMTGLAPTPITWQDGPFTTRGVVLAFMVPRIKSDYNGNSGVVVSTV